MGYSLGKSVRQLSIQVFSKNTIGKPLNHSFRNFFQKVVTIISKMNSVGYRQVYPNSIVAVWGCLKVPILFPTLNQSVENARFSKNGGFPHKFTLSALFGNFE